VCFAPPSSFPAISYRPPLKRHPGDDCQFEGGAGVLQGDITAPRELTCLPEQLSAVLDALIAAQQPTPQALQHEALRSRTGAFRWGVYSLPVTEWGAFLKAFVEKDRRCQSHRCNLAIVQPLTFYDNLALIKYLFRLLFRDLALCSPYTMGLRSEGRQ